MFVVVDLLFCFRCCFCLTSSCLAVSKHEYYSCYYFITMFIVASLGRCDLLCRLLSLLTAMLRIPIVVTIGNVVVATVMH